MYFLYLGTSVPSRLLFIVRELLMEMDLVFAYLRMRAVLTVKCHFAVAQHSDSQKAVVKTFRCFFLLLPLTPSRVTRQRYLCVRAHIYCFLRHTLPWFLRSHSYLQTETQAYLDTYVDIGKVHFHPRTCLNSLSSNTPTHSHPYTQACLFSHPFPRLCMFIHT